MYANTIRSQGYNITPSKSAFGKLKEPMTYSEYINNKKSVLVFDEQLNYNTFNTQPSYNSFSLFNNGLKLYNSRKCRLSTFSKNNLEFNLFSKMDLTCVPVITSSIQSPTNIDVTNNYPFYEYYRIDPEGLLFGNTYCGIDNYLRFRKFYIRCTPYTEGSTTTPTYSCT